MVAFHQLLETHFHLLRGRTDIEAERVESLPFRVADRARFRARLLFRANAFAEQPEWIRVRSERTQVRPHCSLAGSHLPRRAVTGKRILLVGRHGRIAHACEEIVRLVVFAHVIKTETPVVLFTTTALGRAVRGLFLAAVPLAAGPAGLRTAILLRFDADAIKKRRVEFHDRTLCAVAGDAFKTCFVAIDRPAALS